MKDDKLEWFPFHHNKFIRDTEQWSDTEVGVYLRLLSSQWRNNHLINDEDRLRNITTQSPESFKKIWEFMKVKFPKNKDGNLQNLFLEKVRKKQSTFLQNKSDAGSAGAEARWGKPLTMPFDTDTFKDAWELWKFYKKKTYNFSYKTKISEQAALEKISRLSSGKEDIANKIILQSIENQWQGFFNLRKDYEQKFNNAGITTEGIIASINARY